MATDGWAFSALTGGGAGALDAEDGNNLIDGAIALVMVGGLLYPYKLDANSGETPAPPMIIAPVTNPGNKRWKLQRIPMENTVPVGTIVAFSGGYYTNGSNGNFTNVLGNTPATVNALLNADGWYVCNGAEVNVPGSAVHNGPGRYIENLTDGRFLMGSSACGSAAGSNYLTHTHTVNVASFNSGSTVLTIDQIPAHSHSKEELSSASGYEIGGVHTGTKILSQGGVTGSAGGGGGHLHSVDPPTTTTSDANQQENRPLFLSQIYIKKVL